MANSASVYPELTTETSLTFIAGYKVYDSVTSAASHAAESTMLSIRVMDGAMALATSTAIAAAAFLAF